MTDIRRALIGRPEAPELVFTRTYAAPVEDVRDAFTSPERLARWFGTVAGNPRDVGDSFQASLSEDPTDTAVGRVLACDRHRIQVSWSWQGEPETVITVQLRADDPQRTTVTLHHAMADPSHAVGYGGGWEQALAVLARTLGESDPRADETIESDGVAAWRMLCLAPLDFTRTFDAPISRVWHAFTTTEGLAAWWWNHWDDVDVHVDARVGAPWHAIAPAAGVAVGGEYLVVDEPHRLVFTWQWKDAAGNTVDETVELEFEIIESGTQLRLRHSGPWTDDAAAASYREGWHFTLDQLEALLRG